MAVTTMDVVYGHITHLPLNTLRQARWKSMSGPELSGYIDIKIPNKERRLTIWKAWKKQWCTIKKDINKIIFECGSDKDHITHLIEIPEDAILCRTESRTKSYAFGIFPTNEKRKEACIFMSGITETDTQKWMSNIRNMMRPPLETASKNEFEISLIDNEHSKSAGLSGLYGRLSVTPYEIIIKDTHNNKTKATWHWSQISHTYLPLPAKSEDVQRVCTICTSSKFKIGEGELDIFCLEADKLHQLLSSCPRTLKSSIPRIMTSPLPPTPDVSPPPTPPRQRVNTNPLNNLLNVQQSLLAARRMSRSENDLQKFFIHRSKSNMQLGNSREMILLSNENINSLKKVPSVVFANIGFIISTPGCSEPESLHEIHNTDHIIERSRALSERIEYECIDEEEDQQLPTRERNASFSSKLQERDERNDSTRSGVYDEIVIDSQNSSQYKMITEIPPPLPPRKSNNFKNELCNDEKNETSCSNKANDTNRISYLPMLSTGKREQKYVAMTNMKDTLIVSGPVPI